MNKSIIYFKNKNKKNKQKLTQNVWQNKILPDQHKDEADVKVFSHTYCVCMWRYGACPGADTEHTGGWHTRDILLHEEEFIEPRWNLINLHSHNISTPLCVCVLMDLMLHNLPQGSTVTFPPTCLFL